MLLDTRKAEIGMELRLFRLKQHMEEEISQLNSRLDALEVQLTTLRLLDNC